jgi:hypothetical protein
MKLLCGNFIITEESQFPVIGRSSGVCYQAQDVGFREFGFERLAVESHEPILRGLLNRRPSAKNQEIVKLLKNLTKK